PAAADGWVPAPFLAALGPEGAGALGRAEITNAALAAARRALLALDARIARSVLAMARERDLPRPPAHLSARHSVPQRAEAVASLAVVLLVLLAADVLIAIAASAFGVLLYYAIANLAALTQTGQWRLFPTAMQVAGLIGCLLLVAALPGRTLAAGLILLAVGILYRALALHLRPRAARH